MSGLRKESSRPLQILLSFYLVFTTFPVQKDLLLASVCWLQWWHAAFLLPAPALETSILAFSHFYMWNISVVTLVGLAVQNPAGKTRHPVWIPGTGLGKTVLSTLLEGKKKMWNFEDLKPKYFHSRWLVFPLSLEAWASWWDVMSHIWPQFICLERRGRPSWQMLPDRSW